ncbi:MAG TPA: porin family protein [Bacteroidia bacterium]|nr:porin family protein [Bacteroidia bacterium]
MKKPISLLLFLVPFFVSAQQFNAGVIGGLGGTQISGDNLSGFDKFGILAGGYVSSVLSEKFDLEGQLLYITKGSKKNQQPDKNDYTTYLLRLRYIELPILLTWKQSKRFYFEAGPTFGYLLDSYEEDEYGEDPVSRPFKKYELGVVGSIIINVKEGFAVNLRYNSSIAPVREHAGGATYRLNHGQYNSGLLIAFQYTFRPKANQ